MHRQFAGKRRHNTTRDINLQVPRSSKASERRDEENQHRTATALDTGRSRKVPDRNGSVSLIEMHGLVAGRLACTKIRSRNIRATRSMARAHQGHDAGGSGGGCPSPRRPRQSTWEVVKTQVLFTNILKK